MSIRALSPDEIQRDIAELPGWSLEADHLVRSYAFKNFKEALAFIVRVGLEAEGMDHHPEIRNVYARVELSLSTHDAGDKVTARDIELARRIHALGG